VTRNKNVRRISQHHGRERPAHRTADQQLGCTLDLLRVLVQMPGLLSAERSERRITNYAQISVRSDHDICS
jgi:hypothetical protein